MLEKNIKFTNYKNNIQDILNTIPSKYGSKQQRLAYLIDRGYMESQGQYDLYLGDIGVGYERNIDNIIMAYDNGGGGHLAD